MLLRRRPAAPDREPEADESLLLRQRNETLGEISGGVLHDLNNTLTSLLGFAELLVMRSEEGSEARRYGASMLEAGAQARRLLQQVRHISRPEALSPEAFSAHALLEEFSVLLEAMLPASVSLEKDFAARFDTVRVVPVLFYQVVLNLAVNARDAMPDGGVLRIVTADSGRPRAPSEPLDAPGRRLAVTVCDTGPGLAPGLQRRILRERFTTKPHGSGLGLVVARRAAQSMGGDLSFRSEPGEGTAFTLALPAIEEAPVFESTRGEIRRGSGAVLLVDDDRAVLETLSEMAAGLGYDARAFADPLQALEALRADPASADAALLDVDMPGMNGFELASALLDLRPDLPVYLITAKDTAALPVPERAPPVRGRLQKPLSLAQLSQALHLALH